MNMSGVTRENFHASLDALKRACEPPIVPNQARDGDYRVRSVTCDEAALTVEALFGIWDDRLALEKRTLPSGPKLGVRASE